MHWAASYAGLVAGRRDPGALHLRAEQTHGRLALRRRNEGADIARGRTIDCA